MRSRAILCDSRHNAGDNVTASYIVPCVFMCLCDVINCTKSDTDDKHPTLEIERMTATRIGGIKFPFLMDNGLYFGRVPLDVVMFASYQRDAVLQHWKKISASWNPHAALPLSLSWRDNHFWCYNGRQTMTAMLDRGYTHANATVVTGLTYQQEASLFYIHNNAPKKMNGWTKFRGAVEAGYEVQKVLLAEATRFNLTTPLSINVNNAQNADITNVGTLQEPFKKGGMPLVRKVLTIMSKSWRISTNGPVKSAAKGIDLIRGLYNFLHNHQDDNINDIAAVLKGMEPEYIRRLANKKKSRGRIDAAQFRQAFEQVMSTAGRIAA